MLSYKIKFDVEWVKENRENSFSSPCAVRIYQIGKPLIGHSLSYPRKWIKVKSSKMLKERKVIEERGSSLVIAFAAEVNCSRPH